MRSERTTCCSGKCQSIHTRHIGHDFVKNLVSSLSISRRGYTGLLVRTRKGRRESWGDTAKSSAAFWSEAEKRQVERFDMCFYHLLFSTNRELVKSTMTAYQHSWIRLSDLSTTSITTSSTNAVDLGGTRNARSRQPAGICRLSRRFLIRQFHLQQQTAKKFKPR